MLEPLASDRHTPRATQSVLGRKLIESQLDVMSAWGAQRLLLLADPQMNAVHEVVESARRMGMEAIMVADAHAMCAQVTSADELAVVADCLLPDASVALAILEHGAGVAVLPVDPAMALGFERIDARWAWAGLLVVAGALCEKLRQLPADCDVGSSLLRIALMNGVAMRSLPVDLLENDGWMLVLDTIEVQVLEQGRLSRQLREAGAGTPGPRLAQLALHGLGNRLLATKGAAVRLLWVAVLLLVLAPLLAWLEWGALAMVLLGSSFLLGQMAALLHEAVMQGRLVRPRPPVKPAPALAALDAGVLASAGFMMASNAPFALNWFVAFVMVAVVRIAQRHVAAAWLRRWLADRLVLTLILAAGALVGAPVFATAAVPVLILLFWLGADYRRSGSAPGDAPDNNGAGDSAQD
ncbi:hypothetical protein RM533_04785 [Croceicoccus sp. F390]|uniref:Uncharacterized protein n=1 Tax=Croceicoccus esteveae TaxID=3075597 RepID=A0ABU2ZHG0_9SPHN|nr:hypothetical protein [Croceicoccus sp. F390]MDT0575493.1 hypothetical protein [Croceicoccus sp. F390]